MFARRLSIPRTHLRRLISAGAIALAFAGSTATPTSAAASDSAEDTQALQGTAISHAEVLRMVQGMERAYTKVDDYTSTFIKRERVKGRLMPREVMFVKFAAPFNLYIKWTKGKREGQELLYVRGWNDGKIRAHTGKFPDITVDLDPDGSLASRGNRHPITDFGLGNMIDLLARDVRLAGARPHDKVTYLDLGTSKIGDATVRCVEATTPTARWSPYYAYKARMCINQRTQMPVRVIIWDRDEQLLEDYTYKNIRLNVGTTSADFSPENPNYGF